MGVSEENLAENLTTLTTFGLPYSTCHILLFTSAKKKNITQPLKTKGDETKNVLKDTSSNNAQNPNLFFLSLQHHH